MKNVALMTVFKYDLIMTHDSGLLFLGGGHPVGPYSVSDKCHAN